MAGKKGGRPPKTAEQRIREGGTAGNGAISHRAAKKPLVLAPRVNNDNRPACPADLPEEGQDLWNEAIELLIDANAVQMIDVPQLKLLCLHYAFALRAAAVLAEQGSFVLGSTGQMRIHPAYSMFKDSSNIFKGIASEFGLSTLARTRLGLLDVSRRTLESDLNGALGRNPRRTSEARDVASRAASRAAE